MYEPAYFCVSLFPFLDYYAYFCVLEESFTKGRTVRVQEGLPERSWSVGNGPVWKMRLENMSVVGGGRVEKIDGFIHSLPC